MDATLVQVSTVVIGETHNPSILNPDFLASQGIVPKAWGWDVADTFTTPPLSLVRYKNGVTVTVEANKLQVVDPSVEDDPKRTRAATLAAAYVAALPHVRYTAVGINFQSIIEAESPEELLKERFLKPDSCDTPERPLHAAGYRLVYVLPEDARVTLSIDAGQAMKPDDGEPRSVILTRANFHRGCAEQPAGAEVARHLDALANDWTTYQELLGHSVFRKP